MSRIARQGDVALQARDNSKTAKFTIKMPNMFQLDVSCFVYHQYGKAGDTYKANTSLENYQVNF